MIARRVRARGFRQGGSDEWFFSFRRVKLGVPSACFLSLTDRETAFRLTKKVLFGEAGRSPRWAFRSVTESLP